MYFTISVITSVIYSLGNWQKYKKNDEVKFDNIPKTVEDYISLSNGGIRFIDSFQFLASRIDSFVRTLNSDKFKVLEEDFADKWQYLSWEVAFCYENFNIFDDYQKPVDDF